jgi:hypothetical protein
MGTSLEVLVGVKEIVMRLRRGLNRPVLLTILALLCAGVGSATSLSYTGTFTADDQVQYFNVAVASSSSVTFQTWSFGGTWETTDPLYAGQPTANAAGDSIPAGGFFPFLTLFDSTGHIWDSSNQNIDAPDCGPCRPDPVTHYSYDAYRTTLPLPAGNYTLALTVYDNTPITMNWYDGLHRAGQTAPFEPAATFTEEFRTDKSGDEHAPFLLFSSGEKRTGDWAVDITVQDTPEPASMALIAAGLILLFAPRFFTARRTPRV